MLFRSADYVAGTPQRQMHSHPLAHKNGCDLIAVCMAVVVDVMRSHVCPYTFHIVEKVPSTLADVDSAGVYTGNSQAMTIVVPEKQPHPRSLRPVLQQDDELDVLENNYHNVGAAVNIGGFNVIAYNHIDIWVRIEQIEDVQHIFRVANPTHAAELEVSLYHHGLDYSRGRNSITAVEPLAEPFNPFDHLNFTVER